MKKFRIVRDNYAGFEVQVWRIWWPFWVQVGFCNTFSTVENAEQFARNCAQPVVKQLGNLRADPPEQKRSAELIVFKGGRDAS